MAIMTATADAVQRIWEANAEIEKIMASAGPSAIFLQTPPIVELNSTAIEIETVKGYEFAAKSVRRGQVSQQQSEYVNSLGQAEAAARKFPLIRERFSIPGAKLTDRVLGYEKPYAPWSIQARRMVYIMQYSK